ncbi:MAG: NUDIX domain-containing protein [Rikenellaceae bacterium]
MIATKQDNKSEIFPLVDSEGEVIGQATRGECHSGSMLLHPVVHLHLFNSRGEIYLQRRPEWKDIQPNMWDTAVGGHVDYGETVEQALRRECAEELGLEGDLELHFIAKYIFESAVERELVNSYYTIYDGEPRPSAELDGGRFWSRAEVEAAIAEGGILTANFTGEFRDYLCLLGRWGLLGQGR